MSTDTIPSEQLLESVDKCMKHTAALIAEDYKEATIIELARGEAAPPLHPFIIYSLGHAERKKSKLKRMAWHVYREELHKILLLPVERYLERDGWVLDHCPHEGAINERGGIRYYPSEYLRAFFQE